MYRIVHETPDVGGIDHELVPIVLAALEKDPQRRPRPEPVLHELLSRMASTHQPAPATCCHRAAQPPVASAHPPVRRRSRRSARTAAPAPVPPVGPVGACSPLVGVLVPLARAGVGGVWLARLGDDSPAAADAELPTAPTARS